MCLPSYFYEKIGGTYASINATDIKKKQTEIKKNLRNVYENW